jgi:arylsulfatase A-like enzyme
MLTISLSTPDYIGHTFGPNSVEQEDDFLHLDKDLGDFLHFLDSKLGKGNYLIFLTADHGVAHVPAFMKSHKFPAGNIDDESLTNNLNQTLKDKFKSDNLVIGIINLQVYLDHKAMMSSRINKDKLYEAVISYLLQQPGVSRAVPLDDLNNTTLDATMKNMLASGYYPSRSGDIQIIPQPQWILGFVPGGTTHGSWNPYNAHIPLLWYGWNIKPGKTARKIYMTDIAPTVSTMLHIQMPSGTVGNTIDDIVK